MVLAPMEGPAQVQLIAPGEDKYTGGQVLINAQLDDDSAGNKPFPRIIFLHLQLFSLAGEKNPSPAVSSREWSSRYGDGAGRAACFFFLPVFSLFSWRGMEKRRTGGGGVRKRWSHVRS